MTRKLSDDFQKQAEMLASIDKTRPTQINLRRAISAAYYAAFHELCELVADSFIGRDNDTQRAWSQVYRALEHNDALKKCMAINNDNAHLSFPDAIEKFAEHFTLLQAERHLADYDSQRNYQREDAISYARTTDKVRRNLRKIALKHRKAFATFLVFRVRS